jgi:phosphoribosylformimino-5-aminoimidazole carboxamide ribotide isomerase
MLIIPAIDLHQGACVRLEQGDFARHTVYDSDPLAMAKRFAEAGSRWLHLVDLDGARQGQPRHLPILERISAETELLVEFGGGLRTYEAVAEALAAGATRVVVGTAALEGGILLARLCADFGDRIAVGVDARDGLVATRGWLRTSTVSSTDLAALAVKAGASRLIYTDIATDGMLQGPNIPGLRAMIAASSLPIVASGGMATLDHLHAAAQAGAEAAIVGKALYTGAIPLDTLRDWR